MIDFYQWAWDNLLAFIVVTFIVTVALIAVVEAFRGKV